MDIMIANTIPKTNKTLKERGLPADSFFEVIFSDGSSVSERDINWSSISAEMRVGYFGGTKTVFVCTLPVARIEAYHGDMIAAIDVPPGCQVYQAVRSETVITGGRKDNRVIGRTIGIVKDGEVIEEQFANDAEHAVLGTRK